MISALPDVCDVSIVRDTDEQFLLIFTDGNGKAIPITDDDIEWNISESIGGAIVFQKTSAAGSHTDGANGQHLFTVAKVDTVPAKPTSDTTWVHEARRIKKPSGDARVHMIGKFIVQPTGPA